MKDVVSEKGYEQKALHGLGVMLEDVIGIPLVDQLVKARIFDVPSLVAETDSPLGGSLRGGKRGHPDPIAGLRAVLLIELPADRVGFQRTQDAHGSVHLRPGEQVWEIPPPALAGSITAGRRRYGVEQPGSVLIKIAPVIFENHQSVLTASEQEIEEWSGAIERVGQHQVEGARIGRDHSLQQTKRRVEFILAGSLWLMIQKQTNRLTARGRRGQQHQCHLPVIELSAISALQVDGSLQAAGAMTQITGVAFMAIHHG